MYPKPSSVYLRGTVYKVVQHCYHPLRNLGEPLWQVLKFQYGAYFLGLVGNRGIYLGNIGRMEKKMETTTL